MSYNLERLTNTKHKEKTKAFCPPPFIQLIVKPGDNKQHTNLLTINNDLLFTNEHNKGITENNDIQK